MISFLKCKQHVKGEKKKVKMDPKSLPPEITSLILVFDSDVSPCICIGRVTGVCLDQPIVLEECQPPTFTFELLFIIQEEKNHILCLLRKAGWVGLTSLGCFTSYLET